MREALIKCPNCGTEIPISEALSAQLQGEIETHLRGEHQSQLKRAVEQAEARAREQTAPELKLLRDQLAEQRQKTQAAQQMELAVRKEKAALEERQRELDLEVVRKIASERQRLEESIRKAVSEEQSLKLKEKDKQIEDLKNLLEEATRKSQQGSQELQGEVLELDIQTALERLFPFDTISPVPKGVAGADLIQTVRNSAGQACGSVVWEMKNAKHWRADWLAKLKDDQRAIGANLAVLVSVTLPEEIGGFGQMDGVWIASLSLWPALARVLREQLISVAFAHAASEGKNEKMEVLYRYLAGDQFRGRVQGIVEAYDASFRQIAAERRAMEKQWKEREKQLERVMLNTARLYGEMRGIVGQSIACVPALELDDGHMLEYEAEESASLQACEDPELERPKA